MCQVLMLAARADRMARELQAGLLPTKVRRLLQDFPGCSSCPLHATVLSLLAVAAAVTAAAQELPPLGSVEETTIDNIQEYNRHLQETMPLTPEMIMNWRRQQAAINEAAHGQIRPVVTRNDADIVSLEPGETPPMLRLAPGIATTVVFSDATGQPWPVAGYVIGDSNAFEVFRPPGIDGEPGPSHLTVAPLRPAGWSNLVVTLAGAAIPVVLTLTVDPDSVHYRLDLQVLARGPFAQPQPALVGTGMPRAGSRRMLDFLVGVDVPPDAEERPVSGAADVKVWVMPSEDMMVVRTSWPLLSPAFSEVITGSGDVRVYRLPVSSILLLDIRGRVTRVRVEDL